MTLFTYYFKDGIFINCYLIYITTDGCYLKYLCQLTLFIRETLVTS